MLSRPPRHSVLSMLRSIQQSMIAVVAPRCQVSAKLDSSPLLPSQHPIPVPGTSRLLSRRGNVPKFLSRPLTAGAHVSKVEGRTAPRHESQGIQTAVLSRRKVKKVLMRILKSKRIDQFSM